MKAGQLYRVMRAAVQLGFFTASRGQGAGGQPRFRNNRMSAVLREDHPNSLKHMVTEALPHLQRLPACFDPLYTWWWVPADGMRTAVHKCNLRGALAYQCLGGCKQDIIMNPEPASAIADPAPDRPQQTGMGSPGMGRAHWRAAL